MKTITATKTDLVWHDEKAGMYKTEKGYCLVEYETGDARWMSARQAKGFIKLAENKSKGELR